MPRRPLDAVALLLGFWIGLVVFLPLAAPPAFSADRAGADVSDPGVFTLESDLAAAVNAFRAEHRLVPLARRSDLDRVARAHSLDMARRGYLAHRSPEGVDWVGRLEGARVEGFAMAGENVGMTSQAGPNDQILRGWIHSKVHRDNLLARPFNATGVGIARGADGTLYYTQLYLSFPIDD